jgi:predicted cation transporter
LAAVYVSRVPQAALFWLNSISAVVDNATLTAAEIGPALSRGQQRAILMGLLISGGMLIPGNIPNIVAANRLGITSREWARVGLTVGLPLMALCFVALYFFG